MKPIYEPKGAAKEYGDYALNIYTGCPHRCFYCYVPNVLRCDRETFHTHIEPRKNIIEETRKQLEREHITGKLIHLCFTCDPYPTGYDSTPTREIIKLLKEYGNHIQILTKGDATRDFDLLDNDDWYGVTIDGKYDSSFYISKTNALAEAKRCKIKTWVSFEPVLDARNVIMFIKDYHNYIDKAKIGKLNYYPSDIDWAAFGYAVSDVCQAYGLDFYIKDSLRKEMNKCTTK